MSEVLTESVIGVPCPHVRPYVDAYFGYHYAGFEPGVHAGLPSRALTMVVSLDDPVDMCVMPHSSQAPAVFQTLASGFHAGPVGIRHNGTQYGIQLEITPLGSRAMFGMPAAELSGVIVGLDDVVGPIGLSLPDRLREAPTWVARFDVLDDVLGRWIREYRPMAPELRQAFSMLSATDGRVTVAEIAQEVGWSRRHLGERFRLEYGLVPKVMARVMRFERAKLLLSRRDGPDLATVAAVTGYADQAHLTREWRSLAGSTPREWMRGDDLAFLQDEAVVPARS